MNKKLLKKKNRIGCTHEWRGYREVFPIEKKSTTKVHGFLRSKRDVMMKLPHTSSQWYFLNVHSDSKVIVCLFRVFKCVLIDDLIFV